MSHLDTQWQWTLRDTIEKHLPKTLRQNFARFAKFPSYVVSFDGAFRYQLMAEYYPLEFERLKQWVRAGRWAPVGALLDAADVNIPSPESLFRQVLYGNRWFERELGVSCCEIFLPDCFGFSFALPSVAAHCGLKGFSSQKLSKGRAAAEIPFAIGRWFGPDGGSIVAALKPGGYGEPLRIDLVRDEAWRAALDVQGAVSGTSVGLAYYGVGDTGGALDEASLSRLEAAYAVADGPVTVLPGPAGRLFAELTEDEIRRLPEHHGELLLSLHATGGYTSQAAMKRWNRMNEQLGDAAERASVAAHLLSGAALPTAELGAAWQRFLVHQFHDDLPGTSVPSAYELSWNDELLALNRFADFLTTAVGRVARLLDTRVDGQAVVIFNPLSIARRDLAQIDLPGDQSVKMGIFDKSHPVPTTRVVTAGGVRLTFLAELPPLGFKVFAMRPANEGDGDVESGLSVSDQTLENSRLRVDLDGNGDVASLFDKVVGRQLLSRPLSLQLLPDDSRRFPSWEIQYRDVMAPPTVVTGRTGLRVSESGRAVAAIEVRREFAGSSLRQTFRLAADSSRLDVELDVDWRSSGHLLKASFPLAVPDPRAFYDLGLGVIERGVNSPEMYEVPAQQWAALESTTGFGVGIVNDCKVGWDRPEEAELRLSLIHSPRIGRRFRYQRHQDFGRHRMRYGVCAYAGGWSSAEIAWQAARLNQPLRAFTVPQHSGPLGPSASLLDVSDPRIAVRSLKGAEDGEGLVLRFQELSGATTGATVRLGKGLDAVRRLDGMERQLEVGAPASGPLLHLELGPFEPRTLAISTLPGVSSAPVAARTIALPLDQRATSRDGEQRLFGFDGRGRSFPAELWPESVQSGDVDFTLADAAGNNAVACRGQALELDATEDSRVMLLACSVRGDRRVQFDLDGSGVERLVPDWAEFIGQWNRGRRGKLPAYLKTTPVAFVASHCHGRRGNLAYRFCYLFRLELPTPQGTQSLQLPDDPCIRIFAAVIAPGLDPAATAAASLYD